LFSTFLQEHGQVPKSEFFIPLVADQFIKKGGVIKVVSTRSHWFGVTYKEDAPQVAASLQQLIAGGVYPASLWS
jgi:hypothetical protein